MADERVSTPRSPTGRQPTEQVMEEFREARGVSLLASAAAGTLAGFLPARRAAALSPMDALRHE